MKPHPRIRKTVKWGGAAVTVLLVVAWLWSVRTLTVWQCNSRYGFALCNGRVTLSDMGYLASSFLPGWYVRENEYPALMLTFEHLDMGGVQGYAVPLWPAPVLSLIAACFAAYFDLVARRRARIGFCPKCCYDRTGLAAGAVCPECGAGPAAPTPPHYFGDAPK